MGSDEVVAVVVVVVEAGGSAFAYTFDFVVEVVEGIVDIVDYFYWGLAYLRNELELVMLPSAEDVYLHLAWL